ncbi:hypothetical protein ACHAW6_005858 [Cyclotella cf. meneghiniana]
MDGNPVGLAHANPVLDTCVYKVHFLNMRFGELAANVIAEVLYAKCDINCNHHIQPNAIMDYLKNPSMDMSWSQGGSCIVNGRTLALLGRSFLNSRNHTHFWLQSSVCGTNTDEPVFNCWCTHNYGIGLPKTVKEAYVIDCTNGTTFWHDAIEKEMLNVSVPLEVLWDGVAPPPDHQCIHCNMICDVKMENLNGKFQLIARGHVKKA